MASESDSNFPVYFTAAYRGGDARAQMRRDIDAMGRDAKQSIDRAYGEINRTINSALSIKRNSVGSLDLGVEQYREAAREAKAYSLAADEVARSTSSLAKAGGANRAELRQMATAASAAAKAKKEASVEADRLADYYGRLQIEVNKTASSAGYATREFDALRRAEVGAYEGARILEGVYRGTANEIGRVANSARDSAQAFIEAARAQQALEKEAGDLRGALDPMYQAQKRFDDELTRADRLLAAGVISTQEYARAQQLARDSLQQTNAALFNQEKALGLGTTAYRVNGESVRGMRQAMAQTGQQVQDVAISLYSGQRASTVFAQQIPQLVFALTSLEGSSGRVAGRIGALAVMLSGPLASIGLVAASIGIGLLVDKLFTADDATKKAERSTRSFIEVLGDAKSSYEEVTKAAQDYADAQKKSEAATLSSITNEAKLIETNLRSAAAIREKLAAKLADIKADLSVVKFDPSGGLAAAGRNANLIGQKASVEAEIAANKAKAEALIDAAGAVSNKMADLISDMRSSPDKNIRTIFEVMREDAFKAGLGVDALAKKLESIKRQEAAALEALNKTSKASSGVLTDFINPVEGFIRSGVGRRRSPGGIGSTNHAGVDIPVPIGTPVRAPSGGVVIESGTVGGYGKVVFIDHGAGTITRLAHLSSQKVSKGDIVSAGQVVGLSGNTGKSTGPHLHYEVRRNGKIADPRDGRFPTDDLATSTRAAAIAQRAQEEAARETERLGRVSDSAAESILRISAAYDDQPRLIDRIKISLNDLAQIQKELNDPKNANAPRLKELKEQRDAAEKAVADARNKPLREILDLETRNQEVHDLRLQGRELEAQIIERILDFEQKNVDLTKEGAAKVAQTVINERLRNVELEKQNRIRERSLGLVEGIESSLRGAVRGIAGGGGFGSILQGINGMFDSYLDAISDEISDSLFGDVFTDQKSRILGFDKVKESSEDLVTDLKSATAALKDFTVAVNGAEAANDNTALPGAANSTEAGVINVIAKQNLSIEKTLKKTMTDLLNRLSNGLGDKVGGAIQQGFKFAAYGQASSGFLRSVGVKQSGTAAKIGGTIGGFAGAATGIPGADVIGSLIGGAIAGTVGGLFKRTKRGSTNISSIDGDLSYSGSGSLRDGVLGLGGGVQSQLQNIIQSLGGTAGSFGVSVGQRGKKFTVDPTGRGRTKGSGVLSFKTEEEAMRAALLDAIKDGAVAGVSAGAQRLLQAGQDIEKQLAKAVDLQSVYDRLKRIDDPVGFALDALDREFTRLRSVATEAGEGLVEVERLYGIERLRVIEEANQQVVASLRALYDSLTSGNDARSLRERETFASERYNPLAARVNAGDRTAYDAYAEAAQELLSIRREIYGSQAGYFDFLNEVTNTTRTRIDAETNVSSISSSRPGLFGDSTAAPANDNTSVVGALGTQSDILLGQTAVLNAINNNLRLMVGQSGLATNDFTDLRIFQGGF